MRALKIPVRPVDALSLGYFAVVALLVTIFRAKVHSWYVIVAGFAVAALVVCGLLKAHEARPDSRPIAFLRWAYPLVFSILIYSTIDQYVLIFRGHFLDAGMNAWEARAFGGHPNIVIDQIASRPLTEFLYACYFGFYLFFVIPPVALFAARRYADLERYVSTLMAALYTCYLGFLFVPLLGPGYSLAGQFHPATLTGYVIVGVQKFIMATGDPAGACFPSAHVAGAWAATLAIRSIFGRRVYWTLFPFVVCLSVAVVYTRYHYASDALAGGTVALIAFALIRRWYERLAFDVAVVPAEIGSAPLQE